MVSGGTGGFHPLRPPPLGTWPGVWTHQEKRPGRTPPSGLRPAIASQLAARVNSAMGSQPRRAGSLGGHDASEARCNFSSRTAVGLRQESTNTAGPATGFYVEAAARGPAQGRRSCAWRGNASARSIEPWTEAYRRRGWTSGRDRGWTVIRDRETPASGSAIRRSSREAAGRHRYADCSMCRRSRPSGSLLIRAAHTESSNTDGGERFVCSTGPRSTPAGCTSRSRFLFLLIVRHPGSPDDIPPEVWATAPQSCLRQARLAASPNPEIPKPMLGRLGMDRPSSGEATYAPTPGGTPTPDETFRAALGRAPP